VKYRKAIIHKNWRDELFKYISGIIKNNNHKLLAINGVSDYVPILIGIRPVQSISELMKTVKQNSSKWINENKYINSHFEWQEGDMEHFYIVNLN